MDEAYASPDSDGHASLPSPTDTTFDLNDLPFRRRGRPGEHQPFIISSSFMQTEDDSDDDDYVLALKTNGNDPDTIPSSPPVVDNRFKALTPVNSDDPNSEKGGGTTAHFRQVLEMNAHNPQQPDGVIDNQQFRNILNGNDPDSIPPSPLVENRFNPLAPVSADDPNLEEGERTTAHLRQTLEMNTHDSQQPDGPDGVGDEQQLGNITSKNDPDPIPSSPVVGSRFDAPSPVNANYPGSEEGGRTTANSRQTLEMNAHNLQQPDGARDDQRLRNILNGNDPNSIPPSPVVENRFNANDPNSEEGERTIAHFRQALEMNAHNLQQPDGVGDDQRLRDILNGNDPNSIPPSPVVENRFNANDPNSEEGERTIAHFRQALEMNAHNSQQPDGVGDDQQLRNIIIQLQERLRNAEESHRIESEARETKYTNLLEEQNALVKHLQAELDEMVNLMPVDHGSSRMVEEEADEWLEEKSREISQYYDDGLDQIITELHGGGEREDFDEAAEEAEMSLRRVAEEAGLDEPLDKATLAAFGIRQLRTESVLLKRVLIERDGRVKELMQANDEMGRRGEQLREKVRVLEGEKEAIKRTVAEAEERAKKYSEEAEALKVKLVEMEKCIRQLNLEKGELVRKNRDIEDRVKSLETDKASLQRLVDDTKRLSEILKTQHSEEEKRAQGFEEEIQGLRRQLTEENDHVGIIETETLALRQRITELEGNLTLAGKSKEELELRARRAAALEKEKQSLEARIKELENGSEEVDALNRQLGDMEEKLKLVNEQQSASKEVIQQLQQTLSHAEQASRELVKEALSHSEQANGRLAKEKDALKKELEKATLESKASRGRFAQLLHDTAEKEAKWNASKHAFEASTRRQASAFEDIISEIHDPGILDAVNGDRIAMLREVLRLRRKQISESEEKIRRYKGAAKKWAKDFEKSKSRIEDLTLEVKELTLMLRAEKKSSDEKMGQLILALRRE